MTYFENLIEIASILESLNTGLPKEFWEDFSWDDHLDEMGTGYKVPFSFDGKDYFAVFQKVKIKEDEYEFLLERVKNGKPTFGITKDTEKPGSVFSVFFDIMERFLADKKPSKFFFSAKEKSRISLYNSFVAIIEKRYNYTLKSVEMKGDDKCYSFEPSN